MWINYPLIMPISSCYGYIDPLANDVAEQWKANEALAIESGNHHHLPPNQPTKRPTKQPTILLLISTPLFYLTCYLSIPPNSQTMDKKVCYAVNIVLPQTTNSCNPIIPFLYTPTICPQ